MLTCVEVVLRRCSAVKDLEEATWSIASFLGPPPWMSLSEACSTGCIRLLDWIWASSSTSVADRAPHWTLTNFLRSDPHYYHFQFTQSLSVAARRGNLDVVKWLFAHFSGCVAPTSVVCVAAQLGHLAVVQLLWEFSDEVQASDEPSYKMRKTVADGGGALAAREPGNRGRASEVHWDDIIMLKAAERGHFDIVRWLCEYTQYDIENDWEDWFAERLVKRALDGGADDLVQLFLPRGRCVLDYAEGCARIEVIELLLDCGYLRRDAELAFNAIRNLARSGSLALLQQIVLLHSPLPDDAFSLSSRWICVWKEALHNACASGELETTRWLLEHPVGVVLCDFIKKERIRDDFTSAAAENGHWKLLRFLCERKISNDYERPFRLAIQRGQFKCVGVLIEQFVCAKKRPKFNPMDVAAEAGSFETMQFLHNFSPPNVQATPLWWSHIPNSISMAVESGKLELIKWLQANRPDGLEIGDETTATDLELSLYWAARRGHLPVVQWLHCNGVRGCTSDAMDVAAWRGHLDVAKWFYANASGKCTASGLQRVASDGPLRALFWMHTHFPEQAPLSLDGVSNMRRAEKFDLLLFLDAHYPHLITREFVEETKRITLTYALEYADANQHVLKWLGEKYPRTVSLSLGGN